MARSLPKIKPKLPKWKLMNGAKRKEQFKLMLKTALVLAMVLFLLAIVVELWRSWQKSVWDGQETLYLGFQQGERLWLVKIDKSQEEIIMGEIAPNLVLTLSRGFGEQQARNIYKRGEMEKISGVKMVKESLTWTFGLPVKGVVWLPESKESLNLSLNLSKSLLGIGRTNLTRWDLLRLLWLTKSLRFDQVMDFSFTDLTGALEQVRPDGVEVIILDPERVDSWIAQRLASRELVNETCTWEVNNATAHLGLAAQVARLLHNTGVQVAIVGKAEKSQSGIYLSKETDCQAPDYFSRFLNLPLYEEKDSGSHSEITVVIGEDFWQSCCSR